MAFGKLYEIERNEKYANIAKQTFENILRRQSNPKGKYNKGIGSARSLQNFAPTHDLMQSFLGIGTTLRFRKGF